MAIIAFLVVVTPMQASTQSRPYTKKFIITAYYSPIPGQCCYVKGGLVADRVLNGEGFIGADGTAVYPGMLAAPPSYEFGSRINLPGIGALTVHDRGGAIQSLDEGDRLDIWVGHGEEGLARALAFGVQEVTGRVYPPGTRQPRRDFTLESLPAPLDRLEEYLVQGTSLLSMNPKHNERGLSIQLMQDYMRDAGYFDANSNGHFNDHTKSWLDQFVTDYGITSTTEELTPAVAAHLLAAAKRSMVEAPISDMVDSNASQSTIAEAQRTLRFLGYYRGRTDGYYSDTLAASILQFQQDHALVGTEKDPGAGRIGPITLRTLKAKWNKKLVAKKARTYMIIQKVEEGMERNGRTLGQFLSIGWGGEQVRILQTLLADRGFFPHEKINGYFGEQTLASVINYQLSRGIISSRSHESAGNVGPATLAKLRQEEKRNLYHQVRAEGLHVL